MPAHPSSRRLAVLWAGLLAVSLAACAHRPGPPVADPLPPPIPLALSADPLTRANEEAADRLVLHARAAGVDERALILIASLVALDDIKTSSPLGRLVAEQVAGRLVQHGLGLKDVRLRDALVIRPDQGELILSRDAQELARQHQAQFALIGAYTRAREATRISLRLVRLDDARVIAAANYAVEVDERTNPLLPPAAEGADVPGTRPRTLYDSIRDYDRGRPSLHY